MAREGGAGSRTEKKWREALGGPCVLTGYITACVGAGYGIALPLVTRSHFLLSVLLGACMLLSLIFLWMTNLLDPGVVAPKAAKDVQVYCAEMDEKKTSRSARETTELAAETNEASSRKGGMEGASTQDPGGVAATDENDAKGQSGSVNAENSGEGNKAAGESDEPPAPDGPAPQLPREALLTKNSKGRTIWKEKNQWIRYALSDEGYRIRQRYCSTCNIWKDPDTAHCKMCGFCMKRMDHHCPAMGTCVAALNHRFFVAFLLSSGMGSCILLASSVLAKMATTAKWQEVVIILMICFYGFNMLFVLFGLAHCYMLFVGQTTRGNIKHTHDECECKTSHYPLVCCGPLRLKFKWSRTDSNALGANRGAARLMDVIVVDGDRGGLVDESSRSALEDVELISQ
eukprot:CAMPEP_0170194912 /NCGR_PEP_ID=MMETSP0040_2-20121228/60296_1 /TAXON_ID=641309 /ORGANISM="Lotharella oceanica, Strain CCMP622" /LENGTH=400 /DNA_ID=CAMNT_0010443941 /DNA_START=8 /DNA_END=1210 /DNA_ORIENTATION=+